MKYLTSPAFLFYALPYLMGVLIAGTVAQKWIGLHASLETFFFSWIIWLSFIPVPGGLMVMGAITLNLTFKFLLKSKWTSQKLGTNLIHFGILILMIGGLGTLVFKTESVILLTPNIQTNTTQDYIETDFAVLKNGAYVERFDFNDIDHIENLPFKIKILESCKSCKIILRPEEDKNGWVGAAASMMLVSAPRPLNAEETLQGLSFEISGLNGQNGKYLTFEGFPKPPQLNVGKDTYTIIVERRRQELPFSLTLKKFKQERYPGTNRAKNYTSVIDVQDGELMFPVTITMNEPFRYNGYTFYQSSFVGDSSVLAVVQNKAYIFPYIASLMAALGLIIQLILLGRKK